MRWAEFTIYTTDEASDAVCEMLTGIGADGIAICDPDEIRRILEDPASLTYADEGFIDSLGEKVVIKAYFAELDDGYIRLGAKEEEFVNDEFINMIYGNITGKSVTTEEAKELLSSKLSDIGEFLDVGEGLKNFKYVKDEDWANNWKQDYKAFKISDRVAIVPSWLPLDSIDAQVKIMLDPGSAFGTGTHETTSMCAEFIDQLVTDSSSVLDLGTGSGILAIIADKLGAREVEAIDIDKLAVDVAKENLEINGCPDVVCHTGELKDAAKDGYDLIIANIIADVIAMIAPDFPGKLNPGGKIICSGIINTKEPKVLEAFKQAGLEVVDRREKNDWVALVVKSIG
ncbi:MAG: 50S ribosomal protein L11 methyltransferase [Clostridiales bacterium]|nr:50S ribosomal protein L11 methyltransferase [Clostridiales bacterium]